MTVQDLVTSALMSLHYIKAAGRGASASELARGLTVFNRMVDSSNTNRANVFTERIDQWPTVNQKQIYTWGTGGDWNGPRPQRIDRANLLLPTSPVIRRPLRILDDAQWAAIRLQAIYTYPEALYNDGAHPLASIYLAPIPDGVYQVETYSWQANAPAPALGTALSFPPGYEEWWLGGLAIRLAPMHGVPVPPDVRQQFMAAQQGVERMNTVAPRLKNDARTRRGGGYNYLSGMRD